ncbi:MAG: VOC family protein [Cyanosarcina radialis HA8281-LM2]|jgi:methylmalonyl-CoA/ethylmalonyl-CoA epimerase|nr:VOC family protein [Cyanosarcina radialis HA8281-LM2]
MKIFDRVTTNPNAESLSSIQIDHVCLNVPNYEETLRWYQEKLDATITRECTVDVFPDLKLAYLDV